MNEYIATFHTHADALVSHRNLTGAGLSARMMPVPRKLSSSCGTCIRYAADAPTEHLLAEDWEAVYLVSGGNVYEKVAQGDAE